MATVAISVTLAVAGLFFKEGLPKNALVKSVLFITLYIAFQLVIAAFAAIKGLKRTNCQAVAAIEYLPKDSEDEVAMQKRLAKALFERFSDLHSIGNRAITQMAIAHTALRNVCLGVALAIIVISFALFFRGPNNDVAATDQRIINQIRSDPDLADFLRGPRGERGEQGVRGEPGPQGDPGPACSPAQGSSVSPRD